ncbi:acylphosphatase [Candidatus Pacearchaeota archaeon]|nr:acylphosphatase [Candidatus Pacearchaeota archaeon]
MKKANKIIIKGTVQGMFFRSFIKENADALGLTGFVRNLDSGDVEVIIEGEIESVDKMHEICKHGPKHAVVKELEISEIPFQDFQEFKILHI